MSVRRITKVARILARECPYRYRPRVLYDLLRVMPTSRDVGAQAVLTRFYAAVVALPYRIDPPKKLRG